MLQLAFIVLKLLDAIDWPWWIVLSPLWGIVLLTIIVVIIVAIVKPDILLALFDD